MALLLLAPILHAQTPDPSAPEKETNSRLVLVLPFDNRTGQPNLQWIGDFFPDTLDQRLNSAGFLTIARDDRQFALNHLGFPVDFRPTRATTTRIAQTIDADYVVIGSYDVNDGRIGVKVQILETKELRLSPPLVDPPNSPASSTSRTP